MNFSSNACVMMWACLLTAFVGSMGVVAKESRRNQYPCDVKTDAQAWLRDAHLIERLPVAVLKTLKGCAPKSLGEGGGKTSSRSVHRNGASRCHKPGNLEQKISRKFFDPPETASVRSVDVMDIVEEEPYLSEQRELFRTTDHIAKTKPVTPDDTMPMKRYYVDRAYLQQPRVLFALGIGPYTTDNYNPPTQSPEVNRHASNSVRIKNSQETIPSTVWSPQSVVQTATLRTGTSDHRTRSASDSQAAPPRSVQTATLRPGTRDHRTRRASDSQAAPPRSMQRQQSESGGRLRLSRSRSTDSSRREQLATHDIGVQAGSRRPYTTDNFYPPTQSTEHASTSVRTRTSSGREETVPMSTWDTATRGGRQASSARQQTDPMASVQLPQLRRSTSGDEAGVSSESLGSDDCFLPDDQFQFRYNEGMPPARQEPSRWTRVKRRVQNALSRKRKESSDIEIAHIDLDDDGTDSDPQTNPQPSMTGVEGGSCEGGPPGAEYAGSPSEVFQHETPQSGGCSSAESEPPPASEPSRWTKMKASVQNWFKKGKEPDVPIAPESAGSSSAGPQHRIAEIMNAVRVILSESEIDIATQQNFWRVYYKLTSRLTYPIIKKLIEIELNRLPQNKRQLVTAFKGISDDLIAAKDALHADLQLSIRTGINIEEGFGERKHALWTSISTRLKPLCALQSVDLGGSKLNSGFKTFILKTSKQVSTEIQEEADIVVDMRKTETKKDCETVYEAKMREKEFKQHRMKYLERIFKDSCASWELDSQLNKMAHTQEGIMAALAN